MSIGPYGPQSGGGGGTSLTPPVQAGGADIPGGQAGFISLAKAKIQQMIGPRYYLIDDATLTGIANKLWQSVALQQLYAGYEQSPATYGASLEAQIQATILNPNVDPAIDPTIISDYVTAKQSAGASLSTAELSALSNATMAANASVPRPFDTSRVSGYDYGTPMPSGGWTGTGQSFGWDKHYGVDYGTPAGSRIVSPFAGTAHVQTGVAGYGNYVTVTLDNGWKIGFGHVAQGTVGEGTRVNPGDLIAISGSNVGSAQGAVTIVTWQDPRGNYQNPHTVLDPIFGGTTFQNIGAGGAAGTGMPTVNTVLDREYPSIKSDWQTMFGSPPSPEDVYNVLQHGTSPTQWTDYIRSLPGHITGMSVGQIYDLRALVDGASMKALGHAGTDGIVKELHDQSMTSEAQVKLWYDEHSPNDIDKTTYKEIVKANQPVMTNIFNDSGFDPRIASQQALQDKRVAGGHGAIA